MAPLIGRIGVTIRDCRFIVSRKRKSAVAYGWVWRLRETIAGSALRVSELEKQVPEEAAQLPAVPSTTAVEFVSISSGEA
jgi:hypothetical protein